MTESAKDFLFFARNPGTVRVSTENRKAAAISVICAAVLSLTAVFRIIEFRVSVTQASKS